MSLAEDKFKKADEEWGQRRLTEGDIFENG